MTKAERYKARLGGVLQQKLGITRSEQEVREGGPAFCSLPYGRDARLSRYAVVGDQGGLLVIGGWELQPEAVEQFTAWLKETFLDDDEEVDAEKA